MLLQVRDRQLVGQWTITLYGIARLGLDTGSDSSLMLSTVQHDWEIPTIGYGKLVDR